MLDAGMLSNEEINSFAVFDLETTGLPDHNFNKANIIELTMHGFPAENVYRATSLSHRRVNHSITLQFNPRMRISPKAEELTGLNNYMLEKESYFDENAAGVIVNFLKHLQQPVCLVAHNGDKFDFPILKEAFKKLDMHLPPDVLCLDSYKAFVGLDEKQKEDRAALLEKETSIDCVTLLKEEDFKLNTIPFLSDDDTSLLTIDVTKSPKSVAEDFKQPDNVAQVEKTENTGDQVKEDEKELKVDWQTINETTPKQGTTTSQSLKKKRIVESKNPTKTLNRRRLEFPTHAKPPTGFYKLGNVYTRLFGKEPDVTHQAEADVIILKEIMYHYGDSFVKWAADNATLFSSVKALSDR